MRTTVAAARPARPSGSRRRSRSIPQRARNAAATHFTPIAATQAAPARFGRWRAASAFLSRGSGEARKRLARSLRIGIGESVDAAGFLQHAIAPALDERELRALGLRSAGPRGKRNAQRLGIDVAHQPADVLHLAAARFVPGDRARERYGVGEALWKI